MIEVWTDGLCEPVNPASARTACLGFVIKRDGKTISEGSEVIGTGESMTNNVAEYTALIRVLERIRRLRLDKEKIVLMSDSQLVVGQMAWGWKVKKEHLLPLYTKAKILAAEMDVAFKLVPREENEEADKLCRLAYESRRL